MASSAPGRFRTRTNTTGYAHPNCGSPGVGRGRVGIGVTLTVDCIAVPGRIRGRPPGSERESDVVEDLYPWLVFAHVLGGFIG